MPTACNIFNDEILKTFSELEKETMATTINTFIYQKF